MQKPNIDVELPELEIRFSLKIGRNHHFWIVLIGRNLDAA